MRIFSGIYKGRQLQAPKGRVTRPTSGRMREAVFNICQHYIEGANFLDLFAGSGAIGFEALSRGAAFATFVDNDQESARCIKKNRELLQLESCSELIYGDVFAAIEKLGRQKRKYELIYADPPYAIAREGIPLSHLLLEALDAHQILSKNGMLFIEEEQKTLAELKNLTHLKWVSSRNMGRSGLQQYSMQNS
jgi:16S rRNA (guanine(966)-N(2))-methyltransferase RsmD